MNSEEKARNLSKADVGRTDLALDANLQPQLWTQTEKKTLALRNSLKVRVGLLAASMVAMVVGVMTIVTVWTADATLDADYERDMKAEATSVLSRLATTELTQDIAQAEVDNFHAYNARYKIAITTSTREFTVGDTIAIAQDVAQPGMNVEESGDERTVTLSDGAIVIAVSQNKADISPIGSFLGVELLKIGVIGVVVSIIAGVLVASAGLRPVVRLRKAVQRVTATDELRPIPVHGNDELAQLTQSFNEMLVALEQSRARQTQLVSDAGHELKTPLTSMRTNIELLMMMNRQPECMPSDEFEALEKDVIAQIDELSTLIGDLVDLAREHNPQAEEELDLQELINDALKRVKRRRADVVFSIDSFPWLLNGDYTSLNRALVNVLDNAAKWSPDNGVVRLKMSQLDNRTVSISVSDSGPGVPEAERERIFDRFYRSVEARSMPGSGLGLAIVRQSVMRHGGTIVAAASDDGGSMFVITLPGEPA